MTSLFIDVVSSNLMVALIIDKALVHSSKIETNESKYASDLIVPKIEKLLLDNNLDYANCTYELYCNRQRYNNYDVYLSSPFEVIKNLEEYV